MKPLIAIPATLTIVHRAWSRKSLTPLGILAAAITAIIHAIHPWSAPFVLLAVFYLSGTRVTKVHFLLHFQLVRFGLLTGQVKHSIKAGLTVSATGSEGGEAQRTHIQVLANSIVASVLILLHTYILAQNGDEESCFALGRRRTGTGRDGSDVLAVGIVAYVVPLLLLLFTMV